MKVGIYIDRMDLRGGAQRVVSNLCHGWIKRGWEVHLIVESGSGAVFPVPADVGLHRLAKHHKRRGLMGIWDNFSCVHALGQVVRAERLDAVLPPSGWRERRPMAGTVAWLQRQGRCIGRRAMQSR